MTFHTHLLVPEVPTGIQVKVVPNVPQATVFWSGDATEFRVHIHRTDGPIVKTSETTHSPVSLDDLPMCERLFAGVVARNGNEDSQQGRSADFIIHSAILPLEHLRLPSLSVPTLPKNVRVRTLTNVPTADVSWEYDNVCAATDFRVEVYKQGGSLSVLSQTSDSYNISLKQIPFCEMLYVSVQGRNAYGFGQRANSSEFKIYAAPKPPTDVKVELQRTLKKIRVSWKDESECVATTFHVFVRVQQSPIIVTADRNEAFLDWLPSCGAHSLHVVALNNYGSTKRSPTLRFYVPQASYRRNTLLIGLLKILRQPTTGFALLGAHQLGTVPEFPSTLFLLFCTIEQIDFGNGSNRVSEYMQDLFLLDFSAPTDIKIEQFHDESGIMVTWAANKKCGPTTYEVKVYDQTGSVFNRSEVKNSPAKFDGLPKCVPLFLSIKSRGPGWEGDESERKEFTMSGVLTLPKAIKAIPLENAPRVSVSWEYDTLCAAPGFEVAAYRSNGVLIVSETTANLAVMLSGLPTCEALFIGVSALNDFGTGPRANSSQFTIPADLLRLQDEILLNITKSHPFANQFQLEHEAAWCSTFSCLKTSQTGDSAGFQLPCHPKEARGLGYGQVAQVEKQRSCSKHGPSVPQPPMSVRATTEVNVPRAVVSWEYDGACLASEFQVSIHEPEGSFSTNVVTRGLSHTVTNLPVCVTLQPAVLGRNKVGSSPQTNGSPFTIDA
ncbi:hypothetical protein CSKR_203720, partial [Clonorchis sinensis]